MPFKKNGKSSQVNILILDSYLLELSKYKQMKKKNDEEFSSQIENKVQEPSSQLSWNFPRVQYGAYKSSYVENTSTSTKYQIEKKVPYFYELKIKVFIAIT